MSFIETEFPNTCESTRYTEIDHNEDLKIKYNYKPPLEETTFPSDCEITQIKSLNNSDIVYNGYRELFFDRLPKNRYGKIRDLTEKDLRKYPFFNRKLKCKIFVIYAN